MSINHYIAGYLDATVNIIIKTNSGNSKQLCVNFSIYKDFQDKDIFKDFTCFGCKENKDTFTYEIKGKNCKNILEFLNKNSCIYREKSKLALEFIELIGKSNKSNDREEKGMEVNRMVDETPDKNKITNEYIAGICDARCSLQTRDEFRVSFQEGVQLLKDICEITNIGTFIIGDTRPRWYIGKRDFSNFYRLIFPHMLRNTQRIEEFYNRLYYVPNEENSDEMVNDFDENEYLAGFFDTRITVGYSSRQGRKPELKINCAHVNELNKDIIFPFFGNKTTPYTNNTIRENKEDIVELLANYSKIAKPMFVAIREYLNLVDEWKKNENRIKELGNIISNYCRKNGRNLEESLSDSYIAGIFDSYGDVKNKVNKDVPQSIIINLTASSYLIQHLNNYFNFSVKGIEGYRFEIQSRDDINVFCNKIANKVKLKRDELQRIYNYVNPEFDVEFSTICKQFEKDFENKYKLISRHKGHVFKRRMINCYEILESEERKQVAKFMIIRKSGEIDYFYVDKDNIDKVRYYNDKLLYWSTRNNGKYIYCKLNNTTKFLHHIIMNFDGRGKGFRDLSVDHRDRNPRNNLIENLYLATPQEQLANRRKPIIFKNIPAGLNFAPDIYISYSPSKNLYQINKHPAQKLGLVVSCKEFKCNDNLTPEENYEIVLNQKEEYDILYINHLNSTT